MADYTYAYNGPEKDTAKAVLKDAPISTKVSIELCNHLRGKNTEYAKAFLERVIKQQEALPFKRFTDGVGHKRGMASGRYPKKASEAFLDLITMAEANASQKGLAADLIIRHLIAQKASRPFHFGRQRRRQTKRTHVEIAVHEAPDAKKKAKPEKQPAPKETSPKPEAPKRRPEEAPPKKEPVNKEAAPKTTPKKEATGSQPAPKQDAKPEEQDSPVTKKRPEQGKKDAQETQPTPKENAQP